jgi:hypothetical protein
MKNKNLHFFTFMKKNYVFSAYNHKVALQESSGFEVMKEDELYYINGGSGTSTSLSFSAGYQNGNVGINFTATTTKDNGASTTVSTGFSVGASGFSGYFIITKTGSSC